MKRSTALITSALVLALVGCAADTTTEPEDTSPTAVPPSTILQPVELDGSSITGSTETARSTIGRTTWTDDDGYQFEISAIPHIAVKVETATALPGEAQMLVTASADYQIWNRTPERIAPGTTVTLRPFWVEGSEVCEVVRSEGMGLELPGTCTNSAFQVKMGAIELATGTSQSDTSSSGEAVIDVEEPRSDVFQNAFAQPKGWTYSIHSRGNGDSCGVGPGDQRLIWASETFAYANATFGWESSSDSGSDYDIAGSSVTEPLKESIQKKLSEAEEFSGGKDTCAAGTSSEIAPGRVVSEIAESLSVFMSYGRYTCAFGALQFTVATGREDASPETELREFYKDAVNSHLSQTVSFANGSLAVGCALDACRLAWDGGTIRVTTFTTWPGSSIEEQMIASIEDFAQTLVPTLNRFDAAQI